MRLRVVGQIPYRMAGLSNGQWCDDRVCYERPDKTESKEVSDVIELFSGNDFDKTAIPTVFKSGRWRQSYICKALSSQRNLRSERWMMLCFAAILRAFTGGQRSIELFVQSFRETLQTAAESAELLSRNTLMSRIGGGPKKRLYSRQNWLMLS